MKNKGNQKHLTFEQRVDIEKGLTENKSFTEIGRIIGKNPSTISKEVRLHAHTKERPDSGYTHPPCIHRKNCKVTCLCDKMCGIHCKLCRKPSFRCTDICPAYETAECEKLNIEKGKEAPNISPPLIFPSYTVITSFDFASTAASTSLMYLSVSFWI